MDNQNLQIVVSAIDNASTTLKDIAAKTEDSMKQVTSATDKSASSQENLTKAVFSGVAAWDVLKKGVDIAKSFIQESIAAAAESEQVFSQLEAVLKSTGGQAGVTAQQAVGLSQSLQQTTTFSDETTLSAENLLLTFTNIGKDIFPLATKTVLDMSVALGQDTKNSAIQLGKALQDPIEGITALRRVGVNFTQAQQDVIAKLVETGHGMEAQKMILAELTKEFGGSAEAAAKTYAGQLEILKNKFNDMQEVLGEKVLPLIVDFFTFLMDHKDVLIAAAETLGAIGAAVGTILVVGKVTEALAGFQAAMGLATTATLAFDAAIVLALADLYLIIKAVQEYNALKGEEAATTKSVADGNKINNTLQEQGLKLRNSENALIKEKGELIVREGVALANGDQAQVIRLKRLIDDKTKEIAQSKEATKAMDDLAVATKKADSPTANFNVPTKGASDLKDAVAKLKDEYKKMATEGATNLASLSDSFHEKMASIQDDIAKTKQSVADLTAAFNQTRLDETKSVAEDIVASEQKIADLKIQLSKATTDEQKANLQEQLTEEQKNYDSSLAFRTANAAAITAAQSRAKETDLQREIEDYAARQKMEAEEYQKKLATLNQELADKQAEATKETLLYQTKVKQINAILDVGNQYFTKLSEDRKMTTTKEVAAEIAEFQKLQAAIGATKSASQNAISTIQIPNLQGIGIPAHEAGGFVNAPRGTAVPIIAHGGEEVIPAELTGRSRGGTVNIVINNPSVRDDSDIEQIRKQIEQVLRPILVNAKVVHI